MLGAATDQSRRRPVSLIALSSALFLAACIPLPNTSVLGPELSGTLSDREKPVNAVEIVYQVHGGATHRFDCAEPQSTSVTDDAGAFRLEEPKQLQASIPLGDRFMDISVCAMLNNQAVPLWFAPLQGGFRVPGKFELDCDLSANLQQHDRSGELSRCTVRYCDNNGCRVVTGD